jgi:hypothetical protein
VTSSDAAAILGLYELTRQGHLEGDPQKFLAQYGEQWEDLRDGTTIVTTRADEFDRITRHLAETRYLAWDDVAPPRVEVSADGTMAWLLAEIRATAVQSRSDGPDREITYRCSWVQVYTQRDGRWQATVNAPSVVIESG